MSRIKRRNGLIFSVTSDPILVTLRRKEACGTKTLTNSCGLAKDSRGRLQGKLSAREAL
jgi:hypothetical protein